MNSASSRSRLLPRTVHGEDLIQTARITQDPVARAMLEEIERRVQVIHSSPLVHFKKEGRRLLEPARQCQERLLSLAFMYRLKPEESVHLERVIAEMENALALPDWNPMHFLDVAEITCGLAFALDGLAHDLPRRLREQVAVAIIQRSLLPSFEPVESGFTWWVRGHNNWNQVCHGSLVVAALAVAEFDEALCQRVIERAVECLPLAAVAYAPDGAYPEGPMYCCYGTTFHVLMIEALGTATGDEHGLADFPGFLQSAHYIQQMTTPSGRVFNYSDARPLRGASVATGSHGRSLETATIGFNTTLFWFADRWNDPGLIEPETKLIQAYGAAALLHADRFLTWALLWRLRQTGREPQAQPLRTEQHWHAEGKTPVSVHRGGPSDPTLYLAAKGGSLRVSHAHMDVGSFFLEWGGEVWACDPGLQEYGELEAHGLNIWDFSQTGERWSVFRLGPDAHNILRFNQSHQSVNGEAHTCSFLQEAPFPHTCFDLTSLYTEHVTSLRRTTGIKEGAVYIQDDWESSEHDLEVVFQWMTTAKVLVEKDGSFSLRSNHQSVVVSITSETPYQVKVVDCSQPRALFDAPNPHLKRVEIRLKTPSFSSGSLHVQARLGAALETAPTQVL